MVSILTVNIGAAAMPRAEALLGWLANRHEDVFILTETSRGAGSAFICDQFRRAGWHVKHQPDEAGDRGVALISRVPILPTQIDYFSGVSIPARVVVATVDTNPQIDIVGIYVPSRDRSVSKTEKKQQFVETLVAALKEMPIDQRERMVIGGDYNVIARTHVPLHSGFLPFEFAFFDELERSKFIDAYVEYAPGETAYSWVGRTGDGYRYDYIHVGEKLANRIESCAYIHETREHNLTDHAAMTLGLAIVPVSRLSTSDVRWEDEQASLF